MLKNIEYQENSNIIHQVALFMLFVKDFMVMISKQKRTAKKTRGPFLFRINITPLFLLYGIQYRLRPHCSIE